MSQKGLQKVSRNGSPKVPKKCPETGPLYVQKTEPFGTDITRKPLSLARLRVLRNPYSLELVKGSGLV